MIAALRLLNPQGIAGIAACLSLALLLVLEKGETRHLRKEGARFESLYQSAESGRLRVIAEVAAAAAAARAADRANVNRVEAEQAAANNRSVHDLETRLARARADAERLRQIAAATRDRRTPGNPDLPGLPDRAPGVAEAAGEGELPLADRLIATEQAIQLDELIKWVRAQAGIKPSDPRD